MHDRGHPMVWKRKSILGGRTRDSLLSDWFGEGGLKWLGGGEGARS